MLEEIFEINEEFEEITKSGYPFPVAHIGDKVICFNSFASSAEIVPDYIRWTVTPNYIVAMPTRESDPAAFKTMSRNDRYCYKSACFPAVMKNDKKVRKGFYKIYKYKDGFCMKRNEQLSALEG